MNLNMIKFAVILKLCQKYINLVDRYIHHYLFRHASLLERGWLWTSIQLLRNICKII